MANPTLNGIELTGVDTIRVSKSANIIPLPIPTQDSDATEVFDLLGVVKTISITGLFSGGSAAATKSLLDSIEELIDGNQGVITFESDQQGTISCMVASVDSTWQVPGFTATYDIKLIQGSSL